MLHDSELTLRPPDDADVDALVRMLDEPSISAWWGFNRDLDYLRDGLRNEGRAFAIEVGGELAGWLGFDEEKDPDYQQVGLDIMLAPAFQDCGLGPRALRLAIDWLASERGHHRFTIDPALANERAIAAYAKVGFRPIGVMRQYDRGPDGEWRDALLMDLLAEELD